MNIKNKKDLWAFGDVIIEPTFGIFVVVSTTADLKNDFSLETSFFLDPNGKIAPSLTLKNSWPGARKIEI